MTSDTENVEKLMVLPMLLNTAASMILWSILSAYANVFIIPCLLVVFLATYGSLKLASCFDKTEAESIYSLIEISLINTWQPIAIDKHKNTLAISAIVSYGIRMVFIIFFWLTDIRNNLSSMVNHQWPMASLDVSEAFLKGFAFEEIQERRGKVGMLGKLTESGKLGK